MKTFTKTYHIQAPVHDVWHALVNPSDIEAWSGGIAEMTELPKKEFSLWGGEIHGTNKTVTREKKLIQEWFGGNWDKASLVTFLLSNAGKGTKVVLKHTDIPNQEFEDIKKGWDEYYMLPLKKYVEEQ